MRNLKKPQSIFSKIITFSLILVIIISSAFYGFGIGWEIGISKGYTGGESIGSFMIGILGLIIGGGIGIGISLFVYQLRKRKF